MALTLFILLIPVCHYRDEQDEAEDNASHNRCIHYIAPGTWITVNEPIIRQINAAQPEAKGIGTRT